MIGAVSQPDPFRFREWDGHNAGFGESRGRTQVSSIIAAPASTKVIIVDGQSEHATACGTVTYTTVSGSAHNLNIYDGAIYNGADPVLGAQAATTGPSSVSMRIADRLIAQGKATRVIMVPIALGGTTWALYEPTAPEGLFTRTRAAIRRLAALGLVPDAIIATRGVADAQAGTSGSAITASILAYEQGVRDLGCVAPIFVGKFTLYSAGAANATVRGAIDNAIAAGVNLRAGYDGDTNLTVAGGFRLPDGTHPSDTGLALMGPGWADLMFP